ncbi:MAG: hypothetical protein A3C53_06700 [Omnitrophica WOR_2 bacterium RIFCSPHIGHO2_02_FULL_68_15]|nr:MAG: hypothetical protein A3C53_06700 [Omnitrophica WOR_2 bacterium RIFCSPHIGHO2_02_FULL_68_15]
MFLLAAPAVAGSWPTVERWEWRTGYGYQYVNKKSRPTNFQIHPLLLSAVVPMGRVVGPSWLKGRWAWNPEGLLAFFSYPYVRPMVAFTPLQFRYALETQGRWTPYGLLGAGVVYAAINRSESTSQANFNIQAALGLQYTLSKDIALLLEYRHLHVSNAGLSSENAGLDAHTFLAGVSLKR